MNSWHYQQVPLKFQLSDWTIFSVSLPLQVRAVKLIEQTLPVNITSLTNEDLMEGSQGFLIRNLPVEKNLPKISRFKDFLCYVPLKYKHNYIDLKQSFDSYQKKFSSKTKSTIKRKVKKYSDYCGGTIPWKTYKEPGEVREFFKFARAVSKLTYQERLLDAGLPSSEDFIEQSEALADNQNLRAYILFDGERPVSYLYCPIYDGVLIYSYLGYDPAYMDKSVGTVLHWLALQEIFSESKFLYFDFTEGDSAHKSLFATHQRQCANVFFVRRTLRNYFLIYGQLFLDEFSRVIGRALEGLGFKAKVKRFLRFSK